MTELGIDRVAQRTRRKMRRFTVEQRQQMVAESFVAGASVREVAARYGVHANQLSTWRTQSSKKQTVAPTAKPIRFAAVRVASTISDGIIEMDLTSCCIRVRGEVSAAMLREVMGLMR